MTNETMTIYEALNELKMIDKRITEKIEKNFVATHKSFTNKVAGITIAEAETLIRANFNSVIDLIKRKIAIKNALVMSNAGVEESNGTIDLLKYVGIGNRFNVFANGKLFTMAEIIDMKTNLLPLLEEFLQQLVREKVSKYTALQYNQEAILADATRNTQMTFGNKDSIDLETIKKAEEAFIANNTVVAVDPINVDKAVEELTELIGVFQNKIDAMISVHNATTTINISF